MKFCVYLAVFILGLPVTYHMPMLASVTGKRLYCILRLCSLVIIIYTILILICIKSLAATVDVNENEVTCTYLNRDDNSRLSYLIIKFDNMTCDVLNSANDCLETLKAKGVIQITDSHPCTRVSGSDQVHCLIDLARVKEVCCRLDSQIMCSPTPSELTESLKQVRLIRVTANFAYVDGVFRFVCSNICCYSTSCLCRERSYFYLP